MCMNYDVLSIQPEDHDLELREDVHKFGLLQKEMRQNLAQRKVKKEVNAQIEEAKESAGGVIGQITKATVEGEEVQFQITDDTNPEDLSRFLELKADCPTLQLPPASQDDQSTESDVLEGRRSREAWRTLPEVQVIINIECTSVSV